MNAKDIRQTFLQFFKDKGHQIVPSAPLVVKNDPTLMFTNAGMNQFKDFFLGNALPSNRRIADTQKCLRVSGKHNDLEEVGIDTYHHTMFEMLGNWSFGDYFKKESIAWAWELLTEVYGLPKEKLYVTVFEGDQKENLEPDQEARAFWQQYVPDERILFGNKKDNFWEMGDTGPCGPCSEIHIDLRPDADTSDVPGRDLVNTSHPLVIEIWNLVFIQFNRLANGSLEKLSESHVDTGMGFERLAMAIQGKTSNYDTDVFQPLIQEIARKSGFVYGTDEKTDIATRVISDHIRAISFTIADGQLPSNNKAGYVIRRILRRAVRYGYTFLGFKEPFLYELVDVLAEQFDDVFPELKAQADFVKKVIREEELSFLKTLDNGLRILREVMRQTAPGAEKVIGGQVVFDLYDTFGFPYDLTALIARENDFAVDEAGFRQALEAQKERSRAAATSEKTDWVLVHEADKVEFLGYDMLEATANILRYREVKDKKNSYYQVVLDQTPFYPEGGGQVGDRGYLESGGQRYAVTDTVKENDLIIHILPKLPADLEAPCRCIVDPHKRSLTESNHSATHLLHAALRQVLGTHVAQKGSLVNENLLRFDFSHFAKLSPEELTRIEQIVNQKIRENIVKGEERNASLEEAKARGAMALFGEKYGDTVRVITFDPAYSVELCGGTHVPSTGRIGFFKIVSESSVAAGVRRIEAITSEGAEAYVAGQIELLGKVQELLKNPKDLIRSLTELMEENARLAKELEKMQNKELQVLKEQLAGQLESRGGVQFLARQVEVPSADHLRQLAYDLRAKAEPYGPLFLVLGAELDGKPQLAVMLSEQLVKEKGYNAATMVRELAKEIKGGGGGQDFFATAGGKEPDGLPVALQKAASLLV